ncbi:hypothetical protein OC846_006508 [Tilletia horrida]|uniref:DNA 3'-5' helicase n=1 Tax=Tilletia horrida TaxID=155126 RepID=A0AAN6GLI3_9BASI|nr:hypothetical protein OC846_006508 [Tilletia horrida]
MGLDRQAISITASSYWHRMLGLETFRSARDVPVQPMNQIPVVKSEPDEEQPLPPRPSLLPMHPGVQSLPLDALSPQQLTSPPKNSTLSVSTLKVMAKLCGHVVAAKTGGQARALNRLARTQDSFLAVLPTGAGKSLLWQIAARQASAKGQLVCLLLPLNALREDAKRAAADVGLRAFTETGIESASEVPANVEIVVYSLDFVLTPQGVLLLQSLVDSGRLSRLCIDEAHVFFQDVWREVMASGWRLGVLNIPLLLLSATIPPARIRDLASAVALDHLSEVRESIQQPALAYRVHAVEDPSRTSFLASERHPINQHVVKLAKLAQKRHEPTIIFARERGQAALLARLLGCEAYHSVRDGDPNSDELRKQMDTALADFIAGRTDLICGTSALGAGLHRIDVRRGILAGIPYSLLDAVQAAGRCGRDGKRAEVEVVVSGYEVEKARNKAAAEAYDADLASLLSFLGSDRVCRRAPIGRLFDGQATSCFEMRDAQLCDVCVDIRLDIDPGPVKAKVPPNPAQAPMSSSSIEDFVSSPVLPPAPPPSHAPISAAPVSAPTGTKRKHDAGLGDGHPIRSAPAERARRVASGPSAAPVRRPSGSSTVVNENSSVNGGEGGSNTALAARNARVTMLSDTLLERALDFIMAHREHCGYCLLHGRHHDNHTYRSCPDPAMRIWRSAWLRDWFHPAKHTSCYWCGFPLDYCREQARATRQDRGLPETVLSASGKEVVPCCQSSLVERATENPTVFVFVFALLTSRDLFDRARQRVHALFPTLHIDSPATVASTSTAAPPTRPRVPDSWTQACKQRVYGRYKTFTGFWLVLAAMGIL